MIKTRMTLAAAAIAAISFSSAALAANPTLTWADLDLSTDAGKAELDGRVDAAAREICAPQPVTGSRIVRSAPSPRCLSDARTEIRSQIAARMERTRLAKESGAAKGGSAIASARR